ncbi:MAG: hypothetical protein COA52_10860 [Hyphomicrobiales bacterium]|nr:MAG: hypothetical protein COA52_10860 [Hyphomicrobiales bacterium]
MHPRFAPYLFSLFLSGFMTFIVSGIATYRASGMEDSFVGLWMGSWVFTWVVAYPVMLIASPIVKRLVGKCVRS